jgi:hypothetical protein
MSTFERSDEKMDLIRIQNERYSRHHPELREMIPDLIVVLLKDKPKGVLHYGVVFFTSSQIAPDETFALVAIVRHFQMRKILSRD